MQIRGRLLRGRGDVSDGQSYHVDNARMRDEPGPLSATIKTSPLSPSKTRSTGSWRASPNSVMSTNLSYSNDQEEGRSVVSHIRHQQASGNDGLLRVQVESCIQKTTFYVPVSLMLQREVEMQEAAKLTNISRNRWSASKLYSLWKQTKQSEDEEEITLRLTPETSMRDYSELQWKPWLTTSIRAYYNTGTIRIPEDCLGSDILLALEYFGILTSSPDTFVFDSPEALNRIKLWSSYFTHRNAIAEWVISEFRARGGNTRVWVTSTNPKETNNAETLLQVNGVTAAVLEGGLHEATTAFGTHPSSCQLVHKIFLDSESEDRLSKEAPSRMRHDFCGHLKRMFDPVHATISFDVEKVKATKSNGTISTNTRAVLRIKCSAKSEANNWKEAPQGLSLSMDDSKSDSVHPERLSPNPEKIAAVTSLVSNSSGSAKFKPEDTSSSIGKDTKRVLFETGSEESELARLPTLVRSGYSPYGDNDFKYSTGMGHSQAKSYSSRGATATPGLAISSQRHSDSYKGNGSIDEQRHPKRSTPPPDDKRSSPEHLHRRTIFHMAGGTNTSKLQVETSQEMLGVSDSGAPIGFINTALGDLQSVTSALSDPYMDDSTVGSLSSRFLVQSARKLALKNASRTEQSQSIILTDEENENVQSVVASYRKPSPLEEIPKGIPARTVGTVERAVPDEGGKQQNCGYWEGFLASVCESVVPVAPQSNRSASPVRNVTMKLSSVGRPADEPSLQSTITGDIPMKNQTSATMQYRAGTPDYVRRSGGCTNDSVGNNWKNPGGNKDVDDQSAGADLWKTMSNESSVFDTAKSIGQSISSQLDEFLKLALDSPGDASEVPRRRGDQVLNKVPIPPRSRSSPAIPGQASHGRFQSHEHRFPVREGSPRAVGTSISSDGRRAQGDIIARKIRKHSDLPQSRPSAFEMARSRSTGSPKVFEEAQLPPREPRRARANEQKMGIARKKQSAQAKAMPYGYPGDVLIHGQASDCTPSSAKVRIPSTVELGANRGSLSTMASNSDSFSGKGRAGYRTLLL